MGLCSQTFVGTCHLLGFGQHQPELGEGTSLNRNENYSPGVGMMVPKKLLRGNHGAQSKSVPCVFNLVGNWVRIYKSKKKKKKTLEEMKTLSEIASLDSDFKHALILSLEYIMKLLCETCFL